MKLSNRWVESIILISFAALILKLIVQKQITYYINPKLTAFIVISAIVLVLIAIIMLYKGQRGITLNWWWIILFIIPLSMGFFVPPKIISQSSYQLSNDNTQTVNDNITQSEPLNDFKVENNKIIVDDHNFVRMSEMLYMYGSGYKDVEIEIIGKMYKDDKLKENEFAIVRPMMSCCSADTTMIGVLAVANEDFSSNKDKWIKATGKVIMRKTEKSEIAAISIENLEVVEKPKNEFVYPEN